MDTAGKEARIFSSRRICLVEPGKMPMDAIIVGTTRSGRPLDLGSPRAARRQPLTTEAFGKGLRVFRLCKAEHHNVAVVAPQGVCERRRR